MHQMWQTPEPTARAPRRGDLRSPDMGEVLQAALGTDCFNVEWVLDRAARPDGQRP